MWFKNSILLALILVILSSHKGISQQIEEKTVGEQVNNLVEQIHEILNNDSLILNGTANNLLEALEMTIDNKPIKSQIYGHDVFLADSLQVLGFDHLNRVPNSYVLGVGDQLSISIFGISELDALLEVNVQGYVSPESMPKIYIKGLTLREVKEKLQRRYNSFYRFRSDQFVVTVIRARAITANVLGEVRRAGSYRLAATNTVFNALIAAQGINKYGSVRDIKIFSDDGVRRFDLYEFLLGDIQNVNFYLQENDVVQVALAQNIVSVEGAVFRPMKYELKSDEGLTELFQYCGGFSGDAAFENIQIHRYINDQLQVIDVDYRNAENVILKNGDRVIVKRSNSAFRNVVYAEGAVEFPGIYSLSNIKTVKSLVQKAKLLPEAKLDVAFLLRLNPDSTLTPINVDLRNIMNNDLSASPLELQEGDRLMISSEKTYSDRAVIKTTGAVRIPSKFTLDTDSQVTLQQILLMSGGTNEDVDNAAYIIRSNPKNLTEKSYINVDLTKASEIKIHPWDEVVVLSKTADSDLDYVRINGEVRRPKRLLYAEDLNIVTAIKLAGGLTARASHELLIYRADPKQGIKNVIEEIVVQIDNDLNLIQPTNFVLKPNDEIVVMAVPEYNKQSFVSIKGEVRKPGSRSLLSDNESLSSMIDRAGGLTAKAYPRGAYVMRSSISETNRVVRKIAVRLDLALKSPGGIEDIPLKSDDRIIIPSRENVVFIRTLNTLHPDKEVNLIGATYHEGEDALWYIHEYTGGLTGQADKKSISVYQANGSTQSSKKRFLGIRYPVPQPGSTIYVDVKREEKTVTKPSQSNKGVIVNIGTDGKEIKSESIDEDKP